MSLHFVLGASGSGKSYGTYKWMIEEAINHPETQYMILVPDQYTMQIQKQMVSLHPGHAIFNVDVLSFSRLYHRVMEELGGDTLTPLDDTGKNLILRKLANGMKQDLPVLGSLLERNGYIVEVKGLISEMQQYGISPEGMEALISGSAGRRGLQAKLEDVQKLYAAYLECQRDNYCTSESMYPILTKRLRESKLFKNTMVFLDGFTGFTPVQMPLVQELMTLTRETYVAMTIEEEPENVVSEQQLFYTTAKSIRDLTALAEQAGVKVAPYIWYQETRRFAKQSALWHFEKQLFRIGSTVYEGDSEALSIWQAAKPRQESFWLAREIKRLLREEGYQHRDIAVVCGSMDTYKYHLQEAFTQMDISYFIDANSKIMHNPAMELLQGLLEILEKDFSFSSVMRYLRSGFSSITREEADLLEIYFMETGIRGRKAFSKPFTRKAREFSLDLINGLREKLIDELEPCLFTGEASVRFYMEHIYSLMTGLCVEQKLHKYAEEFERHNMLAKAREYRQIYRKIMDLLNQMVVLMGEESLSVASFREILLAGFEELQVGLIPATVDQVLVGDLERTRLNRIKVLFVLGVNDTNIPGNNAKGGMISDMDREYLSDIGVELAPTKRQLQFRQHFYLYQQLTKPSEKLYLSYSLVDNGEKEIRPSYFINTVKNMFPKVSIRAVSPLDMPEHLSELLGQTAAMLRAYAEGSLSETEYDGLYTRIAVLQKYVDAQTVNRLIEQAFLSGGNERLDADTARALYGSVLYGSISRLEQYAACPYGHFLRYGLGLKEPKEYVLESADLGTIFHDVLAGFGEDLKKDNYSWKNFPLTYGEEKIRQRIEQVREQYGDELLLDKARNGYALIKAERILKRSIQVLQKHMQAGSFQNYGLELDFDISCEWNASKELMMRLQGRIDRLDVAAVEDDVYVKVIDYKSGDRQLELDCMYAGLQMQLIVYMDSAINMLQKKMKEKNIHPAAMFYYRVADPVVCMDGAEDLSGLPDELLKEQRNRGILNGDERVVHLLDGEMEEYSRVIPLKLKKDGTPDRGSGVCSEAQFDLMRQFANQKLYEMGQEIMSGHIEKKPYARGDKECGCTYCAYKGVCSFDENLAGYDKKVVDKLSNEEVWDKMQEICQRR